MPTISNSIILPNAIIEAGGLRGKVMRRNSRVSNQGGFVKVNGVWSRSLREYVFTSIPMLSADMIEDFLSIFEATGGGQSGFLMEDPLDRSCTITTGIVAEDGSDWRLYKRYTAGGTNVDREIRRPRTSTVVLYVDGVVTAGTVSATTGIVTWTGADPGEGTVVRWAGLFYVPVHFTSDDFDWDLVRGGAHDTRIVLSQSITLSEIRE